jgi:excisionase family DNA binding protein
MEGSAILCYTVLVGSSLPLVSAWRFIMSMQSKIAMEHQSFLTPQEVSDILRVSVYTVRRWIKEGDLPAYKVGRGWRISGAAIDEWLNQHQSTLATQR